MEDVTGLSGDIRFADQFETGSIENPDPIKSKHSRPNLSKKLRRTVDLLDKYVDPENVLNIETWDVEPYTTQDKPRIPNKFNQLVKSHQVDWKFFQPTFLRLSCLDLYYDLYKTDSFNLEEFEQFLLDSRRHILNFTRTRNVKLINVLIYVISASMKL